MAGTGGNSLFCLPDYREFPLLINKDKVMNYQPFHSAMKLKHITRHARIDSPDKVAIKDANEASDSKVIEFAASYLPDPNNYFGRTVARFYDGSAEVTF